MIPFSRTHSKAPTQSTRSPVIESVAKKSTRCRVNQASFSAGLYIFLQRSSGSTGSSIQPWSACQLMEVRSAQVKYVYRHAGLACLGTTLTTAATWWLATVGHVRTTMGLCHVCCFTGIKAVLYGVVMRNQVMLCLYVGLADRLK